MAKLKAHGTELLRIETVKSVAEGTLPATETHSDGSVHPSLTLWERETAVFMSDGKVLRKYDVRFRPMLSFDAPEGRFHSYGWKLWKKVRKGGDIVGIVARQREAMAKGTSPWREVR